MKLSLSFILLSLWITTAYSQTLVSKKVGETIQVGWEFPNNVNPVSFRVKRATSPSGPFTSVVMTVGPTLRAASFPAVFPSNPTYYKVSAMYSLTSEMQSVDTIIVQRKGKP